MKYSHDEKRKIANVLPIGIGGDIGMYSLLRDFHEQYGLDSIALTTVATRAMSDSSFITNIVDSRVSDPSALVELVREVAEKNANRQIILLTNSDWHVETLIRKRDELAPEIIVPYPSLEVFESIGDKSEFHAVSDHLGIPVPRTKVVDIANLRRGDIPQLTFDFDYPMFAKPASSSEYHYASFQGKKKVYEIADRASLDALLLRLVEAQYPGKFLVQDFIPGDQRGMRSITAYRDRLGNISLIASGRILLEEVTPGTLGIPAAIVTEAYPEINKDVERFLEHVDYHGYANFDVKYDPRTKTYRFFEVNPRIGRNNHYVVAAGGSIAKPLIDDHILARSEEIQRPVKTALYSVVPLRLLKSEVPQEREVVNKLKNSGAVAHPLHYRHDLSLRRRFNLWANKLNYFRKFRAHRKK